jgi:hypothetical protein
MRRVVVRQPRPLVHTRFVTERQATGCRAEATAASGR